MAIYKLISLKEVIAKVYTDLDIKDEQVPISDMVTWGGEAMRKIGGFASLVHRHTGVPDPYGLTPVLRIKDYRAELPCDLVRITGVALGHHPVNGFIPARIATGNYERRKGDVQDSTQTVLSPFPSAPIDKIQFLSDLESISYEDATVLYETNLNVRTLVDKVFVEDGTNITGFPKTYVDEAYYTINPPYIDTSLKEGYAMLSYQAYPLDCDGYPMISDDEDVKEAVYWYINMKMAYPQWRAGRITDRVYLHAETEWKKKKLAAYSNIQMPSPDELYTMQNVWVRLIPRMNEHMTSYENLGSQEKIKNKANQ